MDWTLFLIIVGSLGFGLLLLGILALILRRRRDNAEMRRFGKRGESDVIRMLKKAKRRHGGYLFASFAFKDKKGDSCEIDHIYVSKAGVFVIETKANVGHIEGRENEPTWKAYKPHEEKTFPNPLAQNRRHIDHLSRVYGKDAPRMVSMVIFPYADISAVEDYAYGLSSGRAFIDSLFSSPAYKRKEVRRIRDRLRDVIGECGITQKEHVKSLKAKREGKKR